MPSPKALAPSRYGLLDSHLGVAKADGLGLTIGARPYPKLLRPSRGTHRPIAWGLFHWFNAPASNLIFS